MNGLDQELLSRISSTFIIIKQRYMKEFPTFLPNSTETALKGPMYIPFLGKFIGIYIYFPKTVE
jgi:hypothetical protein